MPAIPTRHRPVASAQASPIFRLHRITGPNHLIRYTLTCDTSHRFDSWFRSASDYQVLADAGQLTCAVCGSPRVAKAVMAPMVAPAGQHDTPTGAKPPPGPAAPAPTLTGPGHAKTPLEHLRAHIEATSDDVGRTFAAEARAIHDGLAPDRPIRGEASGAEVRALLADDIPVVPLPFMSRRRTN